MDILKDSIFELFSFLNNEALANTIATIAMIIIWLLIGLIFSKLSKRIVNKLSSRKRKHELPKQADTLFNMVGKLFSGIFWFFILVMILDELNINLVPVLASAGVIAFAVGFGAQELIKDLISGFFLIVENAFDVGDQITIGDFKGTVTEVGLRRTRLTNWKNEVLIINNGDIRSLINHSGDYSVAVVDITVSYKADLSLFTNQGLLDSLSKLETNYPQILENPEFVGVADFKDVGMIIRFTAKTENRKQVAVERAMRQVITTYCLDNNIPMASIGFDTIPLH